MVDSTSSTISASRSSTIANSTRLQKVPSSSAPGRQDLGSSQATHMTYQYAMPTAYCANQPLVCKHHHSQPAKGDGFEWNVLERRIVIITGVTKKMKLQTDGKHMYHLNFSQQTSWNQLRKRQNGSWQKKTSWSTPPPSQHDDVFNVWDGRKMMSMAKKTMSGKDWILFGHLSINAFISPYIAFMPRTSTVYFLCHTAVIHNYCTVGDRRVKVNSLVM